MTQPVMSPEEIRRIAEAIARQLGDPSSGSVPAPSPSASSRPSTNAGGAPAPSAAPVRADAAASLGDGVFETLDAAIRAARAAFLGLEAIGLERRYVVIEAMRDASRAQAEPLARFAVEETGLRPRGRQGPEEPPRHGEDPRAGRPRPHGDLGRPRADADGAGALRRHRRHHPRHQPDVDDHLQRHRDGRGRQQRRLQRAPLRQAGLGGDDPDAQPRASSPPAGRRTRSRASPSRRSSPPASSMKHPLIRLLVVTGGPGVVQAAMNSGKRAICAGPGNPPAVVDASADLEKAGRDVVLGALVRQQRDLRRREGGASSSSRWPRRSRRR